jgi:hypothetical protein
MLAAVKYLVDELHVDVNAVDHEGNTALHHAAARGDNEMIKFLVSRGADVMAVTREGQTTVDMANAPVQRVEPFPRHHRSPRRHGCEEQPPLRLLRPRNQDLRQAVVIAAPPLGPGP